VLPTYSQYRVTVRPPVQSNASDVAVNVDSGAGAISSAFAVPPDVAVYVASRICHTPLTYDQRRTYTGLPLLGRPATVTLTLVAPGSALYTSAPPSVVPICR